MACPWAFCFATTFGVRPPFKLPATDSLALSWCNLMPTPSIARFGGVQNPLHRAKKKAIRVSEWLFSVKSAVGGRNPPSVDEIASR
jgi:hypothetical protein